jgi:hypothetical protein
MVVTDFSGKRISPFFKNQKMGPIGGPETSVTTISRCVTSQKSEDGTLRRRPEVTLEKFINQRNVVQQNKARAHLCV